MENLTNSNCILKITKGADNYKLIAFARVHNFKRSKPVIGKTFMADYKDKYLRIFNQADYTTIKCVDFKDAIRQLKSFTNY
jgi:hypothetical protein